MAIKERVLRQLGEKQGQALSGEALAEELGVSRTAVWKAVEALRREGYRVSAAPRRGYRMERTSDALSEIENCLSRDSPVGPVICLESVDSTNNYAKKLMDAKSGTLVVANRQTAGRGRRGHSFISPPGTGLYMSLILRPRTERLQLLTAAAAVAVCLELEERAHVKPLIKWVNDIYLAPGPRKVCGILSEAVTDLEGGGIESVVVGIGVNLRPHSFGEDAGAAGAVFQEDEDRWRSLGRSELAAGIAERLMALSERLDDPGLLEAYRARSMLLGEEIAYTQDGQRRRGRALDIDAQGGLVVEDEAGERITLRSGEVFEVRASPFRGDPI